MKIVAPKFPSWDINGINITTRNSQGSNSPAAPPPPMSTSTSTNHTGGVGSLGNVNGNEPTTSTAAVTSTAECDVVAADTEAGVVAEVTSSSFTPPSPDVAGSAQSQASEVEAIGTVPTSTTSTPSLTSLSTSSSSSSSSGSDGAAAFGGDWRDSLPDGDGERYKRIARDPRFENLLDAHFKVGPEREVIKAHRIILAANCQYFENCFSRNNLAKEICMVFPTLDPAGFKLMLDYIYTKTMNLMEFAANMDLLQVGKLVLKSADCARHIGYAEFEKLGIDYMQSQINKENALVLMVLFRQMSRPGLEAVALQVLNHNINEVFKSPHFVSLSEESLAQFLSSDFWYLPEMEVFEGAKNWAVNKIVYGGEPCEGQRQVQVTALMIRDALGVAFYQIRFLLLCVDDFTKILKHHPGLFTAIEMGNIMQYLISPKITAPPQPYVARPRIPPQLPPPPAAILPLPSAAPPRPPPPESNGQNKSISNEKDADKPEAEKSKQEPTPHCNTRGRPSRTQQQAAAAATAHKSQRRKRRYKSLAFAGPAAKKRKMKDEFGKVRPDFSQYVTNLAATTDIVALAESTTLIQGHFTLADMPQSRIYLPNIKNFFLNLDPPQKTPSGEDLRAAMKSHFSRLSNLIFFDLSLQRSTKRLGGLMRQIFAKKINLTIVYYGATIVKVCHATGSLTMTMVGDAQEVLNICCQSDFDLKNLAIYECRLWKLNMVKWDKLDSVVMNGVDGVSNWREIVRACKRVSKFVCDGLGGQKMDIYSDVLKGKENLWKLYLGHATLTCKNLNFPPHEGLREMYLDSVTCPEEFVQAFPRVFPNVKSMLMFELNECEPLALFHLIQMPSLEFIHVCDIKKPTDERALDIQRLRILLGEIFNSRDFAKTDLPFMIRLTTEGKKKRAAATATSGSKKTRPFDPFDGVNWSGMVIRQDPSSTDEEVEKVYKLDYSQGSYEEFFDCFEIFYLWETAPDEIEGGADAETEAFSANGRA